MNQKDDCVFCKIAKGGLPSYKILESERALSFLSISPVNPGHALVIPKEHFADIYEMPNDVLADLAITVKKVSKAVKKATGAGGVNIIMNNERPAGQAVFHAHIHVIPRFAGDGFKHWEPNASYKAGEAESIAKKIEEEI